MVRALLFDGQLTQRARVFVAVAGVLLVVAIFVPLWQMTMVSNQYPEGLRLMIYSYKLEGDLQEINILNHYIGMHPLEAAYFTELQVLPLSFVVGGVLCFVAALLRRRVITSVVLVGGLVSGFGTMMVLVYRLYSYGSNLDPRAAIRIQPFMPAPIGINQLANFRVTTFFHLGSVFFIVALLGLAFALWSSRPLVSSESGSSAAVAGRV